MYHCGLNLWRDLRSASIVGRDSGSESQHFSSVSQISPETAPYSARFGRRRFSSVEGDPTKQPGASHFSRCAFLSGRPVKICWPLRCQLTSGRLWNRGTPRITHPTAQESDLKLALVGTVSSAPLSPTILNSSSAQYAGVHAGLDVVKPFSFTILEMPKSQMHAT
jgi:hypothetical protein